MLGALIGISAHLVWDRRYKEAVRFAACVVALVVVVYACLFAWIGGGLWAMSVGGNALRLSVRVIADYLGNKYLGNTLVAVATVACIPLLAGSRGKRIVEAAIACYFLAAFCFFGFACGKPGSSYTYFLEPGAGMALAIPVALHSLYLRGEIQGRRMVRAALILGLVLNLKSLREIIKRPEPADHDAVLRKLSTVNIPSGTYVMADTHFVLDVVTTGHVPLINDNLLYSLLVINRKVPPGQVMKALTEGKVSYVLLAYPVEQYAQMNGLWWPPDAMAYIDGHYSCEAITSTRGDKAAVGCAPEDAR